MSRMKRNHKAKMAASSAGRRVRRVAAQVKPAAAHMKPLTQSTGAAAKRRAHRTRAWAAPRVERTGKVLQDSVAPTVSAWLFSAARRLDPAKPQRPPWRKLAGRWESDVDRTTEAQRLMKRRSSKSVVEISRTSHGLTGPEMTKRLRTRSVSLFNPFLTFREFLTWKTKHLPRISRMFTSTQFERKRCPSPFSSSAV